MKPFLSFSKRLKAWATALMLLLLLVGACCLVDARKEHRMERRDYARLDSCGDPLQFEDFLAKYPSSKHTEDVRQRYFALVSAQSELRDKVLQASSEELRAFIANNPNQPYLTRLASMRLDTLDWLEVSASPTLHGMESYLAAHPDGQFADQAEAQRQRLDRLRMEQEAQAQADTLAQELDSIDGQP
ncbi:MAG: hypothetical protein LUC86_05295 [Prevotellaceae bacterium]|nr:hypothetical protein [Prevotellaceae bacterium]